MKIKLLSKTKKSKQKVFFTLLILICVGFITSPKLFAGDIRFTNLTISMLIEQKITIDVKNSSLRNILYEIAEKSKVTIVILDDGIDSVPKMDFYVKDKSVKEVLELLLAKVGYTYEIDGNSVSIYKQIETGDTQDNKIQVKGLVVDENNKPIVGATVLVEGSHMGAVTDKNGAFSFKVERGVKIIVSFVGYLEQQVNINKSSITVKMQLDELSVGDVVLTGIFDKARESYVGAVSTITEKELRMFKGQNLLQTLRNIDPALNIVQNNDIGSNPNAIPEINIRGNSSLPTTIEELNEGANAQLNQPLVIMDGFEITIERLIDFNDEDIESINILKDVAGTAMYGSRGANGVIVIKTKQPQEGKLSVSVSAGINIEMPDLSSYNLLNAADKLELERSIGIYNSNNPDINIMLQQRYNEILQDVLEGVDTYWLSEPLRVGVGQRYSARIGGGSSEFKWGISLNHNSTAGVMKESLKETFDGSINLSYTYKNLTFQNNLTINTSYGDNGSYGSFSDYSRLNPYWKPTYDDGSIVKRWQDENGNYSHENPLYNTQFNHKNYTNATNISNHFGINWEIAEGLMVRGKLGITKLFTTGDNFTPAQNTMFDDYSDEDYARKGIYIYNTGEAFDYDIGLTASYSKLFNEKHQLYVGIDYTLTERSDYNYTFTAEGFLDSDFDFLPNGISYAKDGRPSGSESTTRSLGLTSNVNYTYDNKYYADMSFRVDGASQFGRDSRYAPFYSVGVGWNIHREKFISNLDLFNSLRVRASYGRSGSQQFGAYKSLTMYEYFLNDQYMYWNAVGMTNFGNPNLKWQTTDQYNFGVDISVLNGRIYGSLDVFSKKTNSLLSELDIPKVTGYSSYVDNIGSVSNRGFEAALSGYIIRNTSQGISLTISAKISQVVSRIDELSDAIIEQNERYLEENVNDEVKLLYEGMSQSALYAVTSLGIDPSNGMEVFLDKDGNVTYDYNTNALQYVGESEPKFRGNISSMLNYKNFSLNMSFGYHWGGMQYNQTLLNRVEVTKYQTRYNVDSRVYEDRWMKAGDEVFFKGYYDIYGNETRTTQMSSRFIQADNMFTLQSLSVSYRWSNEWLKRELNLQSVNFSANMSDLFYISTIKRERGLAYPFSRRGSLSVNIVF